jgi:conjugal transfer ATP-binding protein TraC
MGFGAKWLGEEDTYRALWRQINRRWEVPTPLRRDLPLVVQIASSDRDNSSDHYKINGRLTRLLTWKVPPESSIAYLFARLQNEVRFPFTLAQTFRAIDFDKIQKRIARRSSWAAALAARHRESALYHREAQDLIGAVQSENASVFNWYYSLVLQGANLVELEDRTANLRSQLKIIQGGDAMEERGSRVLAELSTLPGCGQYGLRSNLVTSRNVGDLAMVYRLSPGDETPFLLFGDRKGGVYSYSLFSRREPSWNKAVLGVPGSGKSMLLNAFLLGIANFDSQAYVLDKGNSYGPIFELLAREMPNQVAVMRLRGGHFQFNPFPLCWALEERERQIANGTYRMDLEGGGALPCPLEDAKLFFESWLDGLVGQGAPPAPGQKNRLDKALKGPSGQGGFFRDFENQCWAYLRRGDRTLPPPRPLSCLLTHLRNEAPELLPVVELWTRQPRAQFFDSGRDTVAAAKYLYCELTGLEEDPLLAVPFIMALMGTIWKRIQNPALISERKAVIIDEAWSFLAQPAFFRILDDIFRTIRKFNGFITLATQSPRDLKDGAARKLLQTISEVFLYQGFSEPEFMQNDLRLTPHQMDLHKSLRVDDRQREVFYANGRGLNRVLSVEIPPALYWFATTDGEDKYWRGEFCRRLGISRGIDHLVRACEGRTIPSSELRIRKVSEYAGTLGLGCAKG